MTMKHFGFGACLLSAVQLTFAIPENLIGKKKATGAVVLGMHRSGTSLLAGLLVKSSILSFPGEDLQSNEENPLGFFEEKNVVGMNDIWLSDQGFSWYRPFEADFFDNNIAIETFNSEIPCLNDSNCTQNATAMNYFERAIDAHTKGFHPWVLNDPRLCITLPTWLRAFENTMEEMQVKPAVVMTYRNPMEVAKSLTKRENGKIQTIWEGLMLWIWYNKMAIINSSGLCRTVTSMETLLANPIGEIRRIRDDLAKCGVFMDEMPKLNQKGIKQFFDQEPHHQVSFRGSMNLQTKSQDCAFPKYISIAEDPEEKTLDQMLYRRAMKLFCDMQSGAAFQMNYIWPNLEDVFLKTKQVSKNIDSSEVNRMIAQKRSLLRDLREEEHDQRNLEETSGFELQLDWHFCGVEQCSNAELCVDDSYCVCPDGTENDGYRGCIDVDECRSTPYPCPGTQNIQSFCVDHDPPVRFVCNCNPGFDSVYTDGILSDCTPNSLATLTERSLVVENVPETVDLRELEEAIRQDIIDSYGGSDSGRRKLQDLVVKQELQNVAVSITRIISFRGEYIEITITTAELTDVTAKDDAGNPIELTQDMKESIVEELKETAAKEEEAPEQLPESGASDIDFKAIIAGKVAKAIAPEGASQEEIDATQEAILSVITGGSAPTPRPTFVPSR